MKAAQLSRRPILVVAVMLTTLETKIESPSKFKARFGVFSSVWTIICAISPSSSRFEV